MPMPSVLYRYDELQYAEPFVKEGIVSFGPAAGYQDSKLSDAQRDNEQLRKLTPPVQQVIVADPGDSTGANIDNLIGASITFHIKAKGEYLRYHILCTSLDQSPRFHDEFPASNCLVTVHDPAEFCRRINAALEEQLPTYYGQSRPVRYYDPNGFFEPRGLIDLCFDKNGELYRWQTEYRILLLAPLEEAHSNRIFLKLGSLEDICSITPK